MTSVFSWEHWIIQYSKVKFSCYSRHFLTFYFMQVRKQQLELGMEQQTDSEFGKESIKVLYCHPAYLAYMQSTS